MFTRTIFIELNWFVSTDGKEEFCGGAALDNPITFQDVCKDVDYTNFVASFQGKLDHNMVEGDKIELHQVIPLSSHEEVTRHIALPNAVFPSDHLALVCELGWKADRWSYQGDHSTWIDIVFDFLCSRHWTRLVIVKEQKSHLVYLNICSNQWKFCSIGHRSCKRIMKEKAPL